MRQTSKLAKRLSAWHEGRLLECSLIWKLAIFTSLSCLGEEKKRRRRSILTVLDGHVQREGGRAVARGQRNRKMKIPRKYKVK